MLGDWLPLRPKAEAFSDSGCKRTFDACAVGPLYPGTAAMACSADGETDALAHAPESGTGDGSTAVASVATPARGQIWLLPCAKVPEVYSVTSGVFLR
jgi:hypothetical protein